MNSCSERQRQVDETTGEVVQSLHNFLLRRSPFNTSPDHNKMSQLEAWRTVMNKEIECIKANKSNGLFLICKFM